MYNRAGKIETIIYGEIKLAKDKDKQNIEKELFERKPWIQKKTGLFVITVVSFSLFLWVAYQIISAEGNWGRGILWGLIFGGSIWVIFYGMNFFHGMFHRNKDVDKNSKK